MLIDYPKRHSIRLSGYDYSQAGAYFVTICTYNRECLFGKIENEHMLLNEAGIIVQECLQQTGILRSDIILDEFVVMPNHLHLIIFVGADCVRPPNSLFPKTVLSNVMKGFKATVTAQVNSHWQTSGRPVWQRGYYDHIVRNDADLNRIREYIIQNPVNWETDENNPQTG